MTTLVTRASKGSELTHGELDANFDRDVDIKTTTYSALVSDNRTTLECNHASTPFTITLGDAATMAAADTGDYEVTVANIGAAAVTVARAGSDTIDEGSDSIVLQKGSSVTLKVNAATDGYNSIARGLGGLTPDVAELNYVNGVTSAIQTQLDAKSPIANPTFTGEIGIGSVNVSETELGILEGATATTAELNILDGVTSTAAELNILDGVTATTAELNSLDVSARAVSGWISGNVVHVENDVGADSTAFDIDAVIAAGWESVGPTGSSATNIWTGMNDIPSGAKAVILKIYNFVSGQTDTDTYTSILYARVTGSSTATGFQTQISEVDFINRSGLTERASAMSSGIIIPLDGSLRFDLYRAITGTSAFPTVSAHLVGWIE